MRTTVDLNDLLMDEARAIAAAEGLPLRAVLEDALRLLILDRRQSAAAAATTDIHASLWPTIDYARPVGSQDSSIPADPQAFDDIQRSRDLHAHQP